MVGLAASCKPEASLGHWMPLELIVGERSELLRHDHAPGVEDEFA
jgi:hypothetical protein